jgi:hypothetical protein
MSLEHHKSVMMERRDMAQANPDYKGVCHVALAQEGHCRPGEVLRNFFYSTSVLCVLLDL